MVTAAAILHGDAARLLGFDAVEHPVALQLGGSDPAELAAAVDSIAAELAAVTTVTVVEMVVVNTIDINQLYTT